MNFINDLSFSSSSYLSCPSCLFFPSCHHPSLIHPHTYPNTYLPQTSRFDYSFDDSFDGSFDDSFDSSGECTQLDNDLDTYWEHIDLNILIEELEEDKIDGDIAESSKGIVESDRMSWQEVAIGLQLSVIVTFASTFHDCHRLAEFFCFLTHVPSTKTDYYHPCLYSYHETERQVPHSFP